MVLPLRKNAVAVSNQLNILILYHTSSRLVTLLKVFDVSLKISDILVLDVNFKFVNLLKPTDYLKHQKV
jgi:hypothetical protein